MSKITFRADDELITQLEEFDASKSEVMRDALREYLAEHSSERFASGTGETATESLDDLIVDRVDKVMRDRIGETFTSTQPQDVNVNITLDGGLDHVSDAESTAVNTKDDASHTASSESSHAPEERKTTTATDENTETDDANRCTQCGEDLSPSHVYCPNCGEKSSHRVFCECGDELRSDWAFCPGCGRRTPAADVLDQP
jgi:flagellar basal body-associated protein FliL/predicted RNA-binding Zn-ribbon protein involved in translation (DUF1610 family)